MAKALPIVKFPDPVLSTRTVPIAPENFARWHSLAADMEATMELAAGIGLAAVQVGQPARLAVVHREVAHESAHLWLFNPTVSWGSGRAASDEEGCLSLPGVFGAVGRPSSIIVRYYDRDGLLQERKCSGLLARVIQHEIDHLDGTLFTERATGIREGQELLEQWKTKEL